MALVSVGRCLTVLMILYFLATVFSFLASVPMILHVYPRSKCILFSSNVGDQYYLGNPITCNVVAYVFLFVILGVSYLFLISFMNKRRMSGHHPDGPYVEQKVPRHILVVHMAVLGLALLLTVITTAGYLVTCDNLASHMTRKVQGFLHTNPFDTHGEEIQSIHEENYRFHRYTNKYQNAYGSDFFMVRVTCRTVMTDPEVHQKLHETYVQNQGLYHGRHYQEDVFPINTQLTASKTNALIESCLAGSWITVILLLCGLVLILIQMRMVNKQKTEQDRISTHSAMLGAGSAYGPDGSIIGSMQYGGNFRAKDGSIISGARSSQFQRGGSRASDRSLRSSMRRDIDDMAINSIIMAKTPQQGRRADNMANIPSHYSSRETGYVSDGGGGWAAPPNYPEGYGNAPNARTPMVAQPGVGVTLSYPSPSGRAVPVRSTADATYLSREEVETEIF